VSGKKLPTVLKDFLGVCFLNTNLYKYITEDGQKCAGTFSEVESQVVDMSRHGCRYGNVTRFPKEISFEFFVCRAISNLQR